MPVFAPGSLQAPAAQLRRADRQTLLQQLLQQAAPLGAYLDPTLAQGAQQARAGAQATAGAQGAQAASTALRRLGSLDDRRTQYAGRVPGGTGPTGLLAGDRQGYQDMLGEQREYADLTAALQGQAAPTLQVTPNAFSMRGGGSGAGVGPGMPAAQQGPGGLNTALAAVEPAGARDTRVVEGVRRARADTRIAEAQARGTEAEARGAELATDPLAQAQRAAGVQRFGARRRVNAQRIGGQTRFTPGEPEALEQEASLYRSPLFGEVTAGREAALLSGGVGAGAGGGVGAGGVSPSVVRALIERGTSAARNASLEERTQAQNVSRMSQVIARETGLGARQANEIALRVFESTVRAQTAGVGSAIDAARYGRDLFGTTRPEIGEAQGQLQGTLETGPQLPTGGADVQGPGAAAVATPDVEQALQGQPPGEYDLSDGSVWRVNPDGSIARVR